MKRAALGVKGKPSRRDALTIGPVNFTFPSLCCVEVVLLLRQLNTSSVRGSWTVSPGCRPRLAATHFSSDPATPPSRLGGTEDRQRRTASPWEPVLWGCLDMHAASWLPYAGTVGGWLRLAAAGTPVRLRPEQVLTYLIAGVIIRPTSSRRRSPRCNRVPGIAPSRAARIGLPRFYPQQKSIGQATSIP